MTARSVFGVCESAHRVPQASEDPIRPASVAPPDMCTISTPIVERVVEAEALHDIITTWWDRPLLRFTATTLWLLRARDDLVIDADSPRYVALTDNAR